MGSAQSQPRSLAGGALRLATPTFLSRQQESSSASASAMLRPRSVRCSPAARATSRPAFPSQMLRSFAAEAGKDVFTEALKPLEQKSKEKPKQMFARGTFDRLQSSTKRLNLVCSLVRGLSYNEAVAQLTFSPKKCSEIVRRCLNTVRYSAENNYGLNPDRLVVSTSAGFNALITCAAEASVGRQTPRVKPLPQGRGHAGWETKPFSQLRIVLREMPVVPGELRLGSWGKEAKFKIQQTSPSS